jgi:hypothetical protein
MLELAMLCGKEAAGCVWNGLGWQAPCKQT